MTLTTATMSSLEMVDFINSTREEGAAELRHDSFMAKVPKVLGENQSPKFIGDYIDSKGRTYKCYNFPKREAVLMAMSYSTKLQAKVYDHMTMLEEQVNMKYPNGTVAQEACGWVNLADTIANSFRMCESAKLGLTRRMLQDHVPSTVQYLPLYAIDAPSDTLLGSSQASHSLTHLLKEHGIEGSTMTWNKKILVAGLLEQKTRQSSNGGLKLYWSITEKGLAYGKNLVSEKSPKETQPYWYDSKFLTLIEAVDQYPL